MLSGVDFFAFLIAWVLPVNCLAIFLSTQERPMAFVGGVLAAGKLFVTIYVFFVLWPMMMYDGMLPATVKGLLWAFFNKHNIITVAIFLVNLIAGIVALFLNCHALGKRNSTSVKDTLADTAQA